LTGLGLEKLQRFRFLQASWKHPPAVQTYSNDRRGYAIQPVFDTDFSLYRNLTLRKTFVIAATCAHSADESRAQSSISSNFDMIACRRLAGSERRMNKSLRCLRLVHTESTAADEPTTGVDPVSRRSLDALAHLTTEVSRSSWHTLQMKLKGAIECVDASGRILQLHANRAMPAWRKRSNFARRTSGRRKVCSPRDRSR